MRSWPLSYLSFFLFFFFLFFQGRLKSLRMLINALMASLIPVANAMLIVLLVHLFFFFFFFFSFFFSSRAHPRCQRHAHCLAGAPLALYVWYIVWYIGPYTCSKLHCQRHAHCLAGAPFFSFSSSFFFHLAPRAWRIQCHCNKALSLSLSLSLKK